MAIELTTQTDWIRPTPALRRAFGILETSPDARKARGLARVTDFHVAPVVRSAFYGYAAAIPFETVDLGIGIEPTSLMLGLLLLSLIAQPKLVFRKPPLAYALFFLYAMIFAVPVLFSTPRLFVDEARWQLMILSQLCVMSWVAFNVMKSERAARTALLVLAVSCAVLAILQQLGLSVRMVDVSARVERVTAFDFHPNNLARILTVGFLALAGLAYAMRKSMFKSRLWVWPTLALIGISIIQTGSRGGMLALAAGALVLVLREGAVGSKVRNVAIVLIGAIMFSTIAFQSEMNRTRFENVIEEGEFARREQIYPIAWRMFLQKPLFGWGPRTGEYELGARLAHPNENTKNPHNLVLFALIATGLVGTIPLAAGLGLTLLTAWKSRRDLRGVLPLSLVVMVFVANMSGVWLHNKLHWFIVAYALSCPFLSRRMKAFHKKMRFSFARRLAIERGLLQ